MYSSVNVFGAFAIYLVLKLRQMLTQPPTMTSAVGPVIQMPPVALFFYPDLIFISQFALYFMEKMEAGISSNCPSLTSSEHVSPPVCPIPLSRKETVFFPLKAARFLLLDFSLFFVLMWFFFPFIFSLPLVPSLAYEHVPSLPLPQPHSEKLLPFQVANLTIIFPKVNGNSLHPFLFTPQTTLLALIL